MNLILEHGVADIINKAAELTRILGVVEEAFNLALLSQQLEFTDNLF